ncbi:MAG: hypothetical protein Q8928_08885 [Bacteroidota bacterium]|nr:hypothetical protein [Bacteroidota bacterium]
MKKGLLIGIIILITNSIIGQDVKCPDWFLKTMIKYGLNKKYELFPFIKPGLLLSDFNGDKSIDCAALIIEKETKKKGILIIHSKIFKYYIFGAGKNFGNGSDNFGWLKMWKVYNNKTAYETQFDKETGDIIGSKVINLIRPAIGVEDMKIAGGLIYWDGRKYIWIHQGE